jgi:hypothetical protein
MGLENYRKASLWAENCPNFLAGLKNFSFFQGKFSQGNYFYSMNVTTLRR